MRICGQGQRAQRMSASAPTQHSRPACRLPHTIGYAAMGRCAYACADLPGAWGASRGALTTPPPQRTRARSQGDTHIWKRCAPALTPAHLAVEQRRQWGRGRRKVRTGRECGGGNVHGHAAIAAVIVCSRCSQNRGHGPDGREQGRVGRGAGQRDMRHSRHTGARAAHALCPVPSSSPSHTCE